jgi:hypothetical protein
LNISRGASVLLSLASGAAEEAAMFGVPALFLSKDAAAPFAELIAQGHARIVDVGKVTDEIAALPARAQVSPDPQPRPDEILPRLDELAHEYAALCLASKV